MLNLFAVRLFLVRWTPTTEKSVQLASLKNVISVRIGQRTGSSVAVRQWDGEAVKK